MPIPRLGRREERPSVRQCPSVSRRNAAGGDDVTSKGEIMTANRSRPPHTGTAASDPYSAASDYLVDAAQRTLLFWDVMRQRGNGYREHLAQIAPHVLQFAAELVVDGR